MQTTPHGWKVFDAATPILTYEYSFGPGTANALAVGGATRWSTTSGTTARSWR